MLLLQLLNGQLTQLKKKKTGKVLGKAPFPADQEGPSECGDPSFACSN